MILQCCNALEDAEGMGDSEPLHDKTNKMTCAPSEDSDQPGHLPSLIRVFTVRSVGSQGPKVSSCRRQRLIRLGGYQADLSLRWAHMPFGWFCHAAAHSIDPDQTASSGAF